MLTGFFTFNINFSLSCLKQKKYCSFQVYLRYWQKQANHKKIERKIRKLADYKLLGALKKRWKMQIETLPTLRKEITLAHASGYVIINCCLVASSEHNFIFVRTGASITYDICFFYIPVDVGVGVKAEIVNAKTFSVHFAIARDCIHSQHLISQHLSHMLSTPLSYRKCDEHINMLSYFYAFEW